MQGQKRARVVLKPYDKAYICKLKINNPRMTIAEILDSLYKEKGIKVGASTITDILRHSQKWIMLEKSNRMTSKGGKYDSLEKALYMWINQANANNVCVNGLIITEKAKEFATKLGIEGISFSSGWLHRFKKRYQISSKTLHGEAGSIAIEDIQKHRFDINLALNNFSKNDIYNADETGLFFCLGPNKTLSSYHRAGTKNSKDRISVLFCANASGTHKLKPLVIGKSFKPRCFKNFDPTHYVTYTSNKKAWMTSVIFDNFLNDLNAIMKTENRHILLLLDNATSHKHPDLSNIKISMLPPSLTSHLQPLDAGIIKSFKSKYRMLVTRKFIKQMDAGDALSISLKDAVKFTHESWDCVTQRTIQKCWIHTGVVTDDEIISSDIDVDNSLDNLLKSIPTCPYQNADEYINCDNDLPTGEIINDNEIIEIIEDNNSVSSEESEKEENPIINNTDVLAAIDITLQYIDQPKIYDLNEEIKSKDELVTLLTCLKRRIEISNRPKEKQSLMTDYLKK